MVTLVGPSAAEPTSVMEHELPGINTGPQEEPAP
jgi:hypothetical protein